MKNSDSLPNTIHSSEIMKMHKGLDTALMAEDLNT